MRNALAIRIHLPSCFGKLWVAMVKYQPKSMANHRKISLTYVYFTLTTFIYYIFLHSSYQQQQKYGLRILFQFQLYLEINGCKLNEAQNETTETGMKPLHHFCFVGFYRSLTCSFFLCFDNHTVDHLTKHVKTANQ